jgi:molybdopterin-synthase adenylyltransferase
MPNYVHQLKLFDPARARPVVLIGAGSIGSFIAFFLAKNGVTDITVYDADTVASHNVPMSLYREDDVGRYKVEALQEIVRFTTGVELKIHSKKYHDQPLKRCSVIASVDDMDNGRVPIWEHVRGVPTIDLFVDTRVHQGYGEVYSIVPFSSDDAANYDKTLFSNQEAAMRICGTHGVAFVSTGLASSAVASLCHFWQTGEHEWQRAFRYDTLEQVH